MGQTKRGEKADRQSMVRLDISRWYLSMKHDDPYAFSAETFIGISDRTKQFKWFRKQGFEQSDVF